MVDFEEVIQGYIKDHIPKSVVVVANAWILKGLNESENEAREHDLFLVHAGTAFHYMPVGHQAPAFLKDDNGVKSKYNMVPHSCILIHMEMKVSFTPGAVKKGNVQLKATGDKAFQGVLTIENTSAKWFNKNNDGPIKIHVTRESSVETKSMHYKLLTTTDFKQIDMICVLGWGFYIRNDSHFIPVKGDGLALVGIDKAIEEKLSSFGTSEITQYF